MDQALDDIIKQQRTTRRGGGGGRGGGSRGAGTSRGGGGGGGVRGGFVQRRGGGGGNFGNKTRAMTNFARPPIRVPQGQWQHDRYTDLDANGGGGGGGGRMSAGTGGNATTKLIVSNLDFGVSDTDVKELFNEFGPMRRAAVHYDKSGRSLGSAEIIFERKMDAARAMKQYNNVPLDGRPMKIELIGANSAASSPSSGSIGSRLGTIGGGARRGGTVGTPRGGGTRGAGGVGGGGARGGRGGRGGGRGGRQPKEEVTAEQLDADLDAYVNKIDAE